MQLGYLNQLVTMMVQLQQRRKSSSSSKCHITNFTENVSITSTNLQSECECCLQSGYLNVNVIFCVIDVFSQLERQIISSISQIYITNNTTGVYYYNSFVRIELVLITVVSLFNVPSTCVK